MAITVINADVVQWAKDYQGEKYHALLSDMPYHYDSIVDRFGSPGSAAPQSNGETGVYGRLSKGFMGKAWDGGELSFLPETWEAFKNVLHPGALGIAFAASRNSHRMATAIEEAGFIIHPNILAWVSAQGYPKSSNAEKILRKRGDVRAPDFAGHSYGLQALKPAVEPIIVFQKPFTDQTAPQINGILDHGTGLYWIDGARIKAQSDEASNGRWPANFVLVHSPGCQIIGYKEDDYQINTFDAGAKPWGDAVGEDFTARHVSSHIPIWKCAEGCPALLLDHQSGTLTSGTGAKINKTAKGHQGLVYNKESRPSGTEMISYGDEGGASRFYFQAGWAMEVQEQIAMADPVIFEAKASPAEKHAGIAEGNTHPTIKPLALTTYLAKLLLPPAIFSPRRLFVPCSGTASEMIGGMKAGWEVVDGVELEEEYTALADQRIAYWKTHDYVPPKAKVIPVDESQMRLFDR